MKTSNWRKGMTAAVLGIALAASAIPSFGTASAKSSELFPGKPAGSASYHFTDIQFLSGTTGRAAGNGFVIGTSDAGSSWQPIYHGTWQFSQLDFINNTTGWALAKSSETGPNALLFTKDGGSTFTKIVTGSLRLERISFADSMNGFGYTRAFAYKTADGGKTWNKIKTPANTRYAEFTDTHNGWALVVAPGFGYKLYRTGNGGASWSMKLSVKSAEATGGAVYARGGEAWAVFDGGAGMSQLSYSVYASGDNGTSWRKVVSQATAGGGAAPGAAAGIGKEGPASPGGHPGNMELVDGAAILAGYSPAAGKIGVGRSLDKGKTWSNLKTIPGYESVISFTSGNAGWMADTSSTSPALYATADGGKTWTKKLDIPVKAD